MAEAETLHDAFIDELRDTYDAEKQLTKALAKLAKASSNPKLRQAFGSHLEETQGSWSTSLTASPPMSGRPRGVCGPTGRGGAPTARRWPNGLRKTRFM